jgi:hypothetical protein
MGGRHLQDQAKRLAPQGWLYPAPDNPIPQPQNATVLQLLKLFWLQE